MSHTSVITSYFHVFMFECMDIFVLCCLVEIKSCKTVRYIKPLTRVVVPLRLCVLVLMASFRLVVYPVFHDLWNWILNHAGKENHAKMGFVFVWLFSNSLWFVTKWIFENMFSFMNYVFMWASILLQNVIFNQ